MSNLSLSEAFTFTYLSIGSRRVLAISARELHSALLERRSYEDWVRAEIANSGFQEGSDFEVLSTSGSRSLPGRAAVECLISLEMARHLALIAGNERGRAVREFLKQQDLELQEVHFMRVIAGLALLPAPRAWVKRFEPSYYQALAKLTGTIYSGHANGTPQIFGKITEEWVYQVVMPPEVLILLRARRQNSQKLHQWLAEGGLDRVGAQINAVTVVARSSANYADFRARCTQAFDKPGQLSLIYPWAA